jgi:hypothetical protein
MTTIFTKSNGQTPAYPDDLRSTVGERRLIELALEAVQIVGEELPRPVRALQDQPSPKMLLTLLTYCYASGILGSDDIEWACGDDAAARYICANTLPGQDTIRRFRRANRPWVEACLLWVYGKACLADETSTELAGFVRQKLELAVLMDTAACE